MIPHAALAGILMKVGWDIIDWRFLSRIHRVQHAHLLVMLITLGLTVFLDLVTAVAIGLIAAGMAAARQLERLELDSVVSVPLLDQSFFAGQEGGDSADAFSARVGLVALRGSFTVASSVKLINTISVDIRDHVVVILDFSETVYVDDSAALVVEQLVDVAIAEDTECLVMGLEGLPAATLQGLNVLKRSLRTTSSRPWTKQGRPRSGYSRRKRRRRSFPRDIYCEAAIGSVCFGSSNCLESQVE